MRFIERFDFTPRGRPYPNTSRKRFRPGLFAVAYDFPSVKPPGDLVALSPPLYEQEQARVSSRFEEAVRLAEKAFLAGFGRLVAHLTERITGTNDDGRPKVFRFFRLKRARGLKKADMLIPLGVA